ncbi:hypothetical protein NKDENANG_01711 [Candidatus Entotheonellaceae bacterium PAL068K]
MLAGQLFGDPAPAFEGDILHIQAVGRVEEVGQQVILRGLTGASHNPVVPRGPGRADELLDAGDRGISVHPQQKGVFGHAGNRGKGGNVDAEIGLAQRCGVKTIQGHHDDVVVAMMILEVTLCFSPGATGLVLGDERFGGELVLLDDALLASSGPSCRRRLPDRP